MDKNDRPDLMAAGYQAYGFPLEGAAPGSGAAGRLRDVPATGQLARHVLLSIGQPVQLLTLMLMAPLISDSIGVWLRQATGAFAVQLEFVSVFGVAGAIVMAAVTLRWSRTDRGRVLRWAGLVWALLLVAGSFLVTMQWWLVGLVLLGGALWGVSLTLSLSLLAEAAP